LTGHLRSVIESADKTEMRQSFDWWLHSDRWPRRPRRNSFPCCRWSEIRGESDGIGRPPQNRIFSDGGMVSSGVV